MPSDELEPYYAGLAFDWLNNQNIFSKVLFECLNGGGAGLTDISDVEPIYEAFIRNTGDRVHLNFALIVAYRAATNPRLSVLGDKKPPEVPEGTGPKKGKIGKKGFRTGK
jgi:hypothetical protein